MCGGIHGYAMIMKELVVHLCKCIYKFGYGIFQSEHL